MTAATQLALPVALPIDPWALAAMKLEPLDRGRLIYNPLDLCSFQRAAVEEALRLIQRGEYPEVGR